MEKRTAAARAKVGMNAHTDLCLARRPARTAALGTAQTGRACGQTVQGPAQGGQGKEAVHQPHTSERQVPTYQAGGRPSASQLPGRTLHYEADSSSMPAPGRDCISETAPGCLDAVAGAPTARVLGGLTCTVLSSTRSTLYCARGSGRYTWPMPASIAEHSVQ